MAFFPISISELINGQVKVDIWMEKAFPFRTVPLKDSFRAINFDNSSKAKSYILDNNMYQNCYH